MVVGCTLDYQGCRAQVVFLRLRNNPTHRVIELRLKTSHALVSLDHLLETERHPVFGTRLGFADQEFLEATHTIEIGDIDAYGASLNRSSKELDEGVADFERRSRCDGLDG